MYSTFSGTSSSFGSLYSPVRTLYTPGRTHRTPQRHEEKVQIEQIIRRKDAAHTYVTPPRPNPLLSQTTPVSSQPTGILTALALTPDPHGTRSLMLDSLQQNVLSREGQEPLRTPLSVRRQRTPRHFTSPETRSSESIHRKPLQTPILPSEEQPSRSKPDPQPFSSTAPRTSQAIPSFSEPLSHDTTTSPTEPVWGVQGDPKRRLHSTSPPSSFKTTEPRNLSHKNTNTEQIPHQSTKTQHFTGGEDALRTPVHSTTITHPSQSEDFSNSSKSDITPTQSSKPDYSVVLSIKEKLKSISSHEKEKFERLREENTPRSSRGIPLSHRSELSSDHHNEQENVLEQDLSIPPLIAPEE